MIGSEIGGVLVVLAPDLPGRWTGNPPLLGRLTAALEERVRGPVRVTVMDRSLIRVAGPGGVRRCRVSASHEAGRVGLAVAPPADPPADPASGPATRIGFDLCGPGRETSIGSALPLVLTDAERDLLRRTVPRTPGAGPLHGSVAWDPAMVWTAVEALTKLAGVRLLTPTTRPRLTGADPLRATAVTLTHHSFDGLTGCVAVGRPPCSSAFSPTSERNLSCVSS